MGYKVKWVQDNLGISRKALRGFEKIGLMPPNENGNYRDYTDDDIERIWIIRVLQGIGYTLKEIVNMVNDEQFDYENSIANKIKQLEQDKQEIERHLGYANTIKFSGRIPMPKEIPSIKFKEFQKKALDGWNIYAGEDGNKCSRVMDILLNKPKEEWTDSELDYFIGFFENNNIFKSDMSIFMTENLLLKSIVKKKSLGVSHPEIQLLVKMIYENQQDLCPDFQKVTTKQFARYYSSSYMVGDIAHLRNIEYSTEECAFIADAVAIFGGYINYNSIEKEF